MLQSQNVHMNSSMVFLSSRIYQFQMLNHHSQINILTLFLIAVRINYRRCRRWFPRGFRRPIEGSWVINRRIFRWDLPNEKKLLFRIGQRRIVISRLKRARNTASTRKFSWTIYLLETQHYNPCQRTILIDYNFDHPCQKWFQ